MNGVLVQSSPLGCERAQKRQGHSGTDKYFVARTGAVAISSLHHPILHISYRWQRRDAHFLTIGDFVPEERERRSGQRRQACTLHSKAQTSSSGQLEQAGNGLFLLILLSRAPRRENTATCNSKYQAEQAKQCKGRPRRKP